MARRGREKPWALAGSVQCTEAPRSPLAGTVNFEIWFRHRLFFALSLFCLFMAF